jgi:acetyl-CoA carboxylase biotin carboxyl carrier protein
VAERIVRAEMAGVVLRVGVQPGSYVRLGEELLVLESMKMEIPVTAPAEGAVRAVHVVAGTFVQEGDPLVVLA